MLVMFFSLRYFVLFSILLWLIWGGGCGYSFFSRGARRLSGFFWVDF